MTTLEEQRERSESTWEDFVERFARAIPVLSGKIERHTRIEQCCAGDRTTSGLVRAQLRFMLSDPPQQLLQSIVTFGEAYEWYVAGDGPPAKSQNRSLTTALREMRTASIRLRPILPSDIPQLYSSSLDPRWSFKWRYRGATPSFEDFTKTLAAGTLSQMIIERRADTKAVGLVSCYNARMDVGIAYIAFTRIAPPIGSQSSEMMEGGYLFISFIFRNWNFRKLYAEVPGFTWDQFSEANGAYFHLEGVLRDHDYFDGHYWDQRIAAIYRDEWTATATDVLNELYITEP